jgi:low affinity Fe/Cu permease
MSLRGIQLDSVDAASHDGSFRRFAYTVASAVGTHWAFLIALVVIIAWAVTGPLFHFSDSWQLVINTGTTIVTFLMVFLIQATQNRDGKALQLKLDELIRSQRSARNVFADLEDATEDEVREFEEEFKALRKRGLSQKHAARAAAEKATSE